MSSDPVLADIIRRRWGDGSAADAQRFAAVSEFERGSGIHTASVSSLIANLTIAYDLHLADLLGAPDPLATLREQGFTDTADAIERMMRAR